jgi:hypothetical protein
LSFLINFNIKSEFFGKEYLKKICDKNYLKRRTRAWKRKGDIVPANIAWGVLKKLAQVMFKELPHATHNVTASGHHDGFKNVNLAPTFL